MKARLVPVYFKSGMNEDFQAQLENLKKLLAKEVEFLDPVALGFRIPDADAVVFPQLLGDAFKQIEELKRIELPFLVLTSEFGTVNMWDWEIVSFMKSEGIETFAPYNIDLTKKICRSLAVKREMKTTKFLVYQDNPGEGMQAEIFKRFYWWEETCTKLMQDKFGISIEKKSFKALAEEAKSVPDNQTAKVWEKWNLPTEGVSQNALNSALKIYIAVKRDVEKDPSIRGVGINCLNESFYSDTTPCLAWNMLFEETGILWACEADTMTLLTKYMIHRSLGVPIMMSNIYPFLMGMAALKHEKIEGFPEVKDPENYCLVAHCGYLGVLPKSFSTQWSLRPKVLAIVDDNATAIDARLPTGDITLSKLDPTLSSIQIIEGILEGYVQYSGSDCRNGALIHVRDGYRLMDAFYSHHNLLITGHRRVELKFMAKALGLEVEEI
ncbi:MAG: hypothetical protein AMS17_06880 [Spirochaetes bacterium DG_61]|nr:MAG: hypothetical protein AMS17_06880 [Spirochaetes bacterium DG_61]